MSKRVYVGVTAAATTGTAQLLSTSNLSTYFSYTDGSDYSWKMSNYSGGGIKLVPENVEVDGSEATITFTAKKALTNVTIYGAYCTEEDYDTITLTVSGSVILNESSGVVSYKQIWSGSLASGKTIILNFSKDNSNSEETEENTYFIINCDVSTTFPAINNKAKTVKKMFIGVSNKARTVKKGYIGVNGVAKLFFKHTSQISLPIEIEGLSQARKEIASATVENYVLFSGGTSGSSSAASYANLDIYDNNFTHTATTSYKGTEQIGISMSNYAFFYGGMTGFSTSSGITSGRVYDKNLTVTTGIYLTHNGASYVAGTSLNGNAILSGGTTTNSIGTKGTCLVDNSLTKTALEDLSYSCSYMCAETIGNYAVFVGGRDGNNSWRSNVHTYDTNYTYSCLSISLQDTTWHLSPSASTGKYGFFSLQDSNYLNAIDTNLTLYENITPLTYETPYSATNLEDYVIFQSNVTDYENYLGRFSSTDYYDENFTKIILEDNIFFEDENAFYDRAAETLNNYAFFAGGGYTASSYAINTVNVYTLI